MDILSLEDMSALHKDELLSNVIKALSCLNLLQMDYLKGLLVVATTEYTRATCDGREQEASQWYEITLAIHRVLNSYYYLYRNQE